MSEPGQKAVIEEYRRLARDYDSRWAFYVEATVRETMARLDLSADARVLDIACGTGALLARIATVYPGAHLAGLDLSEEMLARAATRLPPEAQLRQGSADALPFPDNEFDAVITTNAFHFFRRPERALAEMKRALRPGGRLLITDWCDDYLGCWICDKVLRLVNSAHYRVYGSDTCRRLLEAAGFEAVTVERYKISRLWGLMTATAKRPDQRTPTA